MYTTTTKRTQLNKNWTHTLHPKNNYNEFLPTKSNKKTEHFTNCPTPNHIDLKSDLFTLAQDLSYENLTDMDCLEWPLNDNNHTISAKMFNGFLLPERESPSISVTVQHGIGEELNTPIKGKRFVLFFILFFISSIIPNCIF